MSDDTRREQVKEFFDRMEQDPRTPAELDAIQAQAWGQESEEALLRRAAKTVREQYFRTQAGPWTVKGYDVVTDHDDEMPTFPAARCGHGGTATWIAMLGPQLAEPLAVWLEKAAQSAEIVNGTGYSVQREAIAVARALLGEPALTDPVGDDRQEEK